MPMANAVAVGLLLVALALGAILVPSAWEEWSETARGLWPIASPWALAFSGMRMAMLDAVASGAAVALLALWTVLTDEGYRMASHLPSAR
jgi:hypothetical protein